MMILFLYFAVVKILTQDIKKVHMIWQTLTHN